MVGLLVGIIGYTILYWINEMIVDAGYARRKRKYHKEIRESAAAARAQRYQVKMDNEKYQRRLARQKKQ